MFFIKRELSRLSEIYYLEPSLYPSITDNVEAVNTLIQERHNRSESFITVKVSRRTQRVKIYHEIESFWKSWKVPVVEDVLSSHE